MYQVYIQYFTFSFVLNSLPIPQFRLLRLTAMPLAPLYFVTRGNSYDFYLFTFIFYLS